MRIAVVGCGEMGKLHARKLAAMKDVDLVGVCDKNRIRAEVLSEELGCDAYHDCWELMEEVEAAVVATNPYSHAEVCEELINNYVDVLVEKPMAVLESDARMLTEMAQTNQVVLQVGHIERFNPVFRRIAATVEFPFNIEVDRHSKVCLRQQEIDVVLDLMIHDIDLILSIAKTDISKITASGSRDFAIAELKFIDGSTAILRANRKAARKARMWAVNEDKHYLMVEDDYLADELRDFIACVQDGRKPLVGGEQGAQALRVALEISRQVNS